MLALHSKPWGLDLMRSVPMTHWCWRIRHMDSLSALDWETRVAKSSQAMDMSRNHRSQLLKQILQLLQLELLLWSQLCSLQRRLLLLRLLL